MPALNDLLVKISTDATVARKFRENPHSVIADSRLSGIEESILLSRDPKLIQSSLHDLALKDSLAASGDTVWTVIVVL